MGGGGSSSVLVKKLLGQGGAQGTNDNTLTYTADSNSIIAIVCSTSDGTGSNEAGISFSTSGGIELFFDERNITNTRKFHFKIKIVSVSAGNTVTATVKCTSTSNSARSGIAMYELNRSVTPTYYNGVVSSDANVLNITKSGNTGKALVIYNQISGSGFSPQCNAEGNPYVFIGGVTATSNYFVMVADLFNDYSENVTLTQGAGGGSYRSNGMFVYTYT